MIRTDGSMSRQALAACAMALGLALPAAIPAAAQDAVSYASMQARQGSLLYRDNCASCHGDRLQGALEAPPLSGAEFKSHWWGQPLSAMHNYIVNYMPQDRPGALPPEEYAQITAFMLRENDVESAGSDPLPSDPAALDSIMLPAAE